MKIDDLQSPDEGNYTCFVSNRFDNISHTFHLNVINRTPASLPMIVDDPKNQTVYVGDDVEIKCSVYTPTSVLIEWLKHYKVNGTYYGPLGPYIERIQVSSAERF